MALSTETLPLGTRWYQYHTSIRVPVSYWDILSSYGISPELCLYISCYICLLLYSDGWSNAGQLAMSAWTSQRVENAICMNQRLIEIQDVAQMPKKTTTVHCMFWCSQSNIVEGLSKTTKFWLVHHMYITTLVCGWFHLCLRHSMSDLSFPVKSIKENMG